MKSPSLIILFVAALFIMRASAQPAPGTVVKYDIGQVTETQNQFDGIILAAPNFSDPINPTRTIYIQKKSSPNTAATFVLDIGEHEGDYVSKASTDGKSNMNFIVFNDLVTGSAIVRPAPLKVPIMRGDSRTVQETRCMGRVRSAIFGPNNRIYMITYAADTYDLGNPKTDPASYMIVFDQVAQEAHAYEFPPGFGSPNVIAAGPPGEYRIYGGTFDKSQVFWYDASPSFSGTTRFHTITEEIDPMQNYVSQVAGKGDWMYVTMQKRGYPEAYKSLYAIKIANGGTPLVTPIKRLLAHTNEDQFLNLWTFMTSSNTAEVYAQMNGSDPLTLYTTPVDISMTPFSSPTDWTNCPCYITNQDSVISNPFVSRINEMMGPNYFATNLTTIGDQLKYGRNFALFPDDFIGNFSAPSYPDPPPLLPDSAKKICHQAQPYNADSTLIQTDDFENATTTASGIQTSSGSWTLNNAVVGNTRLDHFNGTQGIRVNGHGSLSSDSNFLSGASTVTIQHALYGNGLGACIWQLWYSTDSGATYTQAGSDVITSKPVLEQATFRLNVNGNVRFKIIKTDNTPGQINFDDFSITPLAFVNMPWGFKHYFDRNFPASSYVYYVRLSDGQVRLNTSSQFLNFPAPAFPSGDVIEAYSASVSDGWVAQKGYIPQFTNPPITEWQWDNTLGKYTLKVIAGGASYTYQYDKDEIYRGTEKLFRTFNPILTGLAMSNGDNPQLSATLIKGRKYFGMFSLSYNPAATATQAEPLKNYSYKYLGYTKGEADELLPLSKTWSQGASNSFQLATHIIPSYPRGQIETFNIQNALNNAGYPAYSSSLSNTRKVVLMENAIGDNSKLGPYRSIGARLYSSSFYKKSGGTINYKLISVGTQGREITGHAMAIGICDFNYNEANGTINYINNPPVETINKNMANGGDFDIADPQCVANTTLTRSLCAQQKYGWAIFNSAANEGLGFSLPKNVQCSGENAKMLISIIRKDNYKDEIWQLDPDNTTGTIKKFTTPYFGTATSQKPIVKIIPLGDQYPSGSAAPISTNLYIGFTEDIVFLFGLPPSNGDSIINLVEYKGPRNDFFSITAMYAVPNDEDQDGVVDGFKVFIGYKSQASKNKVVSILVKYGGGAFYFDTNTFTKYNWPANDPLGVRIADFAHTFKKTGPLTDLVMVGEKGLYIIKDVVSAFCQQPPELVIGKGNGSIIEDCFGGNTSYWVAATDGQPITGPVMWTKPGSDWTVSRYSNTSIGLARASSGPSKTFPGGYAPGGYLTARIGPTPGCVAGPPDSVTIYSRNSFPYQAVNFFPKNGQCFLPASASPYFGTTIFYVDEVPADMAPGARVFYYWSLPYGWIPADPKYSMAMNLPGTSKFVYNSPRSLSATDPGDNFTWWQTGGYTVRTITPYLVCWQRSGYHSGTVFLETRFDKTCPSMNSTGRTFDNSVCGFTTRLDNSAKGTIPQEVFDEIMLAPNPAKNTTTLLLPKPGATVTILDAKGVLAYKTVANNTKNTLDVQRLSAGVYSVIITTTEGNVTIKKLVVMK